MKPANRSMLKFKVIIAGSRDFSDYDRLRKVMDHLLENRSRDREIVIVSGTARGADSLGERYAEERGYTVAKYPANWREYGHAAGFIRNEEMAKHANALVAFWDGQSRGTEHMIKTAGKYHLAVRIVKYKKERK